jgi:hypothetical protein
MPSRSWCEKEQLVIFWNTFVKAPKKSPPRGCIEEIHWYVAAPEFSIELSLHNDSIPEQGGPYRGNRTRRGCCDSLSISNYQKTQDNFLTFHQTITGNNSNPSTSEKTNSCANSEEKVWSIRYAWQAYAANAATRQPRGWEHTTVFQPSYLFRVKFTCRSPISLIERPRYCFKSSTIWRQNDPLSKTRLPL